MIELGALKRRVKEKACLYSIVYIVVGAMGNGAAPVGTVFGDGVYSIADALAAFFLTLPKQQRQQTENISKSYIAIRNFELYHSLTHKGTAAMHCIYNRAGHQVCVCVCVLWVILVATRTLSKALYIYT